MTRSPTAWPARPRPATASAGVGRTYLSVQQNAYQAALKAGANIIQPSLLDFLR